MEKKKLSSLGKVTKKEVLITADHIDGSNILIFETQHPYSGYYGTTVPDLPDTSSYFLVTKLQHEDDRIIRSIQGVKKSTGLKFDAVPGRVSFHNKYYAAIRVRCVPESKLPAIKDAFVKDGIEFMPGIKQAPVEALINITKYINTEEVEEGIFIDLDSTSFAYLKIDKLLDWDKFESLTGHVRNNVEGISFDAGLAVLYNSSGIVDTIRVYDDKRSLEKLRIIRKRYLDSI